MAQLDTMADTVDGYSSDTENVLEIAEILIHNTLANTKDAYLAGAYDADLYLTTIKLQSHIDGIINELNARETATINGGTF
jgi:hypothetical protein